MAGVVHAVAFDKILFGMFRPALGMHELVAGGEVAEGHKDCFANLTANFFLTFVFLLIYTPMCL